MNRTNMLTALALGSVLRQANPGEDAGAQSAAPAETPAAAEARKRAAASNFLPIVRGRLPLIFVHALRFDKVLTAMGTKDASAKFATSVGKVFDIRKGRNFGYIGADWKPTAEDVAQAEAWIAQVGSTNAKGVTTAGDSKLMQTTLDQYKERGLASASEAAAQSAARGATRAKVEGATSNGAAGTVVDPQTAQALPGQAKTEEQAANTADDLLG